MILRILLLSIFILLKITIVASAGACLFGNYTLYGTRTPSNSTRYSYNSNSFELGLKFHSNVDGYVTGVRFYKRSSQTGTFSGSLWSITGEKISTASFGSVADAVTGWQSVNFSSVIKITANTSYIVSYHTDGGRYYYDDNIFKDINGTALTVDNYPLHGTNGTRQGVL